MAPDSWNNGRSELKVYIMILYDIIYKVNGNMNLDLKSLPISATTGKVNCLI